MTRPLKFLPSEFRRLRADGVPLREIAAALDISYSRARAYHCAGMPDDCCRPEAVAGELTAEKLRVLADYNPETGHMTWRLPRVGVVVGAKVGSPKTRGYLQVSIFGRIYAVHRLIWLHVHGRWPTGLIDHANGKPDDNRLVNLREATFAENSRNRKPARNNTSGHQGVYASPDGTWFSKIRVGGPKFIYLGTFKTREKAAEAYRAASLKHHGDFSPFA